MTIIDAQLHEPAVAGDLDGLDRDARYRLMLEVELGYMDAVGVDKAVLFPIDDAWGLWARAQAPDRFAVVSMVTPPAVPGGIRADLPELGELVARRAAAGEVVGMRAMHTLPGHLLSDRADDAPVWTSDIDMYEPLMEACLAAGLPLFMSTAGALDGPAEVARRHPDLVVIVDHLGMRQNPTFGLDSPPFGDLPALLELAARPNIRVKVSGVPTLSTGAYPFTDLWESLDQVVAAFGAERLMWGSDISRVMGRAGTIRLAPEGREYAKHTYAEALFYIKHTDRLTAEQREWLLGRTAATVLGWGS